MYLADNQPWSSIERACEVADAHAAYHLRTVRNLISATHPSNSPSSTSTRSSAACPSTSNWSITLFRKLDVKDSLATTLKQLRMSGMLESLEARLHEARRD